MREHHGQGFRIYYTIAGGKVVVLLAGSTKGDQDRGIARARQFLLDYLERQKS